MSAYRLEAGGRIDRSRTLSFTWGGRRYRGHPGDTLASALLANGIDIVGRSFKYHRPRGLIAAGIEEPNAIVQAGEGALTVPNLKATQIALHEGLVAAPVNCWPSASFDLMAVNGLFKRILPAAFYYKTFMWPRWHLFEPAIRRAAGLGRAPQEADPDSYVHRFAHVDMLIVGAGAAGLAAALAAGQAGKRVMIVDADFAPGGGLLWDRGTIDGIDAEQWLVETLAALAAMPNVVLLPRTLAFGLYDHALVGLSERLTDHLPPAERHGARERLWKVRAERILFATGAFERPLQFANNDLPGVMLANAAQHYALRFGVAPGRSVAVATTNDSGYEVAFALLEAGPAVSAIVDSRPETPQAKQARAAGITVLTESVPVKAHGRRRVRALSHGPADGGNIVGRLVCDTVLMAGGWNPAVQLHSHSGAKLRFDEGARSFLPVESGDTTSHVGAAAGIRDLAEAVRHARAIAQGERVVATSRDGEGPVLRLGDGDPAAHHAWVDFQNDVTAGDVQLAARENYRSVEHLKRYTTLGMASDQGKTANVNAIAILSGLLDRPAPAIGTTRFRPPFDPVSIGAFAGHMRGDALMPVLRLAAHDRHVALGAHVEEYGRWLRASAYPRTGESEAEAIVREVHAVRGGVGLFDASPLGKIEVRGPDAATFLDRMYVNRIATLKPGHCRYALMLNEHGIVYDDGIVARIAEDHFLVGTTSSHAAAIAEMFQEWLQCEWPELRVLTANVTTAWAVMTIAGPKAREVLARIGSDIALDATSFPHMTMREGRIDGVPVRIQRVSFTGELSYEIAVPWYHGAGLFDALMEAGQAENITPFGIEALTTMRLEKGFLHVGSDTDGTTLPQDIGFADIIARKPGDFVGRRSTTRPDGVRGDRRQFVGLEVADGGGPLPVGGHVLAADAGDATLSQGWVTSATHSPTLDRPLALGLFAGGRERIGQPVQVWDMGRRRRAILADPRFFDPTGERMHG
jgi:sarcosine oxidase subunit alpha